MRYIDIDGHRPVPEDDKNTYKSNEFIINMLNFISNTSSYGIGVTVSGFGQYGKDYIGYNLSSLNSNYMASKLNTEFVENFDGLGRNSSKTGAFLGTAACELVILFDDSFHGAKQKLAASAVNVSDQFFRIMQVHKQAM